MIELSGQHYKPNLHNERQILMSKRISVINQLRPRIMSQGMVDLEEMARRIAKNTTFNVEEIYGMLRLYVHETNAALQAGETVKIDGLLQVAPNMKVGGSVNMSLRSDRGALAGLNNPRLWTGAKIINHAHISKTTEELVTLWNTDYPDDPVED